MEDKTILHKLRTNDPSWRRQMALQMSEHGRQTKKPLSGTIILRWPFIRSFRQGPLLAAAIVLLAATGVWIYHLDSSRSPEQLLARAYSEQRTLDLRIPMAKYAPLQRERGPVGSSLNKPSALLKAEYLIKAQIGSQPENASILAAKGRAEILEWQYDDALKSLRHALDLNPDSPETLCDLATAYVQRGDLENRPLDYGQAIEYLGQALRKNPNDLTAVFNRALVEERLSLVEEAQKDWEQYLRLDPKGPWSNEARRRLNELRQKLKKGLNAPSAESDPQRASAVLLESLDNAANAGHEWPSSLDEEYLDLAVRDWLPNLTMRGPSSGAAVAKKSEWKALQVLGRVFTVRHHDSWLLDMTSSLPSAQTLEGWKELGKASLLNEAGDFDSAARAAQRAVTRLRVQSRAGSLRAIWERAYALQRLQQGDACLAIINQPGNGPDVESYPWLASQFHLEHAICSSMVGNLRANENDVQEAFSIADLARYDTLSLRCLHVLGIQVATQDADKAWSWFTKGLQRHWSGSYRPFRVYQFYAEMSLTPESRGEWQLARTLMAEAVAHVQRTPNRLLTATALHNLAADSQLAGYPDEALGQLDRSALLFDSLPTSRSKQAIIFSSEIYKASLQSQQAKYEDASRSLLAARQNFAPLSQYWIWLHYYQAQGEVHRSRGESDEAELALGSALYISEFALSGLRDESDRLFWEQQTGQSYRTLVSLEFQEKHNPEKALEFWEWHLSAPVRSSDARGRPHDIDFATLEPGMPPPKLSFVATTRHNLKDVTVVSYLLYGDTALIWLYDDRGVYAATTSISADLIERTVRTFLRLCSDRSSNIEDVRRIGKQLYGFLIAPVESHLDISRVLIIEPDGILNQIPFTALVMPNGDFVGQHYSLVSSPGLGYLPAARRGDSFSSEARALIVGNASGGMEFGVKLPPLADAETEAVRVSSNFPHSILLLGNRATIDEIQRELPVVNIFHFAGHAIVSSTRNGLVLARLGRINGSEDSSGGFLDATHIRQLAARNLHLVVLSACATGGDEGGPVSPQSLVGSFLRSGVPHVVASRWDVDSRFTGVLMQEFYENLRRGENPAIALRTASQHAWRQNATQHPYYWAAFTEYGLN
jgi:CHAT domain-containing protein/cytochrome c-type biogenesis protein CcmH/NrfG